MTVYLHGNFGLNREYMAGVLKSSLDKPNATGDEIAAPFGYKAPFTARYKSWLNKTGLITGSKVTELTPIGEVVWENDPKFQSAVTQWLLHHELTGDPDRAEAWNFFAQDFMPSTQEFTVGDLQNGLSMKLMSHHPTHFGRNAPMIKVIARKIIQCYANEEALGSLGIITQASNKRYAIGNPKQLGPWGSPQELLQEYS